MHCQQYFQEIESLLIRTESNISDIESRYKFTSNDVRRTALKRYWQVLNGARMSAMYMCSCLNNDDWWRDTCNVSGQRLINRKKHWSHDFDVYHNIALIHGAFSMMETTFRILLRHVAPNACNQGTDSFNNIYKCLLNSHLSAKPDDSIELLDLMREVRNTIHNNARYYDRSQTDKDLTYKGKSYSFRIGHGIDFMTPRFILNRLDDIRTLMVEIIEDPNIGSITDDIIDPCGK